MSALRMKDLELRGKKVLIRQDLNVPIDQGEITSHQRILASLPTIRYAIESGAKTILMSHLGRPEEGHFQEAYSLASIAKYLSATLGQDVRLERHWLEGIDLEAGEVVLCENVRFNRGEKTNDDELAKRMAALCDIYIMDAFGTAHRAHASTHGVAKYAGTACAGPLLARELEALSQALKHPASPLMAVVGGAKVSSKLPVLESLSQKVDQLIVGGGIANTFLVAAGKSVGKSLYEPTLVDDACRLMKATSIPLPTDVVVASAFSATAKATIKSVDDVLEDEMILDIGPTSAARVAELLMDAQTIVWNGPLGVFEFPQFSAGTRALAHAVASSQAFSIAGGGDTLAAIDHFEIAEQVSYISTGGGAFLEFLEGRVLPSVAVLESRANEARAK